MAENSIQQGVFDYSGIDAETRALCIERVDEIRSRLKTVTVSMIEIGERLAEVKGKLKHGQFGAWLQAEFALSESTAQRFMNVYAKSVTVTDLEKNLHQFAPAALYMLTAKSTPKKAVEAAVKRASKGERITVATARQIKATFDMVAGSAVKVERDAEPEAVKRTARDVPYRIGEIVLHVPTGLRTTVASITPDGMVKLRPMVSNALTRSIDWAKPVSLDDIAMGKAGVAVKPVRVEKQERASRTALLERITMHLNGASDAVLETVLHLLQESVAGVA